MTELRLCLVADEDDAPDSFPFPLTACAAERDLPEQDEEDAIDVARRLEQTLDELQERLDRVKEELDTVYRFPTPDDWTPFAA